MADDTKDLAAAFEELNSAISDISKKLETVEKTVEELPTKEDVEKLVKSEVEQAVKPYGKPVPTTREECEAAGGRWVRGKCVLSEGEEGGEEEEGEEKEQIYKDEETGEEYPVTSRTAFMGACLKAGRSMKECSDLWEKVGKKTGEKTYPAPAVAKLLAYLERLIGKEFTKRNLTHIRTRILGARTKETLEEEVEDLRARVEALESGELKGPKYVLPGGEILTDKDAFMERALRDWDIGLEHQKVESEGEKK